MVEKQKIRAIAAKQYKNRGEISRFSKKAKNYNNNIVDINLDQKNNFYLVLSFY